MIPQQEIVIPAELVAVQNAAMAATTAGTVGDHARALDQLFAAAMRLVEHYRGDAS